MKTYQTKVLICILCFATFIGQSQILDPTRVLKRQVERKAAEKLNDKLDQALDKALDNALSGKKNKGQDSTQTTQDGEGRLSERIGKMMDFDVKPKSNYAFSSSILQKMTVISKSKTEISYLKLLFSKESTAMSVLLLDKNQASDPEKGVGTMVMDLEQKAFFTFNVDKKGNKNYFGLRLKEQATQEAEKTTTTTQSEKQFTKTGKTKTIMGYTCEGYQMEGDNGDTFIMWITTSPVEGMNDYAKTMQQYSSQQRIKQTTPINSNIEKWAKEGKAVLGHDHISKNGDQVLTELEKISLNDPSNFNTEGYKSAFEK